MKDLLKYLETICHGTNNHSIHSNGSKSAIILSISKQPFMLRIF